MAFSRNDAHLLRRRFIAGSNKKEKMTVIMKTKKQACFQITVIFNYFTTILIIFFGT